LTHTNSPRFAIEISVKFDFLFANKMPHPFSHSSDHCLGPYQIYSPGLIGASSWLAGVYFLVSRPALRSVGGEGSPEFAAFNRRLLRLAQWTLLIIFLSGLLAFWLQIVSVAGVSLADACILKLSREF